MEGKEREHPQIKLYDFSTAVHSSTSSSLELQLLRLRREYLTISGFNYELGGP